MTTRGVAQEDLFWQDADWKESSSVLREAHERRRLVCHGYCLMLNHCHLEVAIPDGHLSRAIQGINQKYAMSVSRAYQRVATGARAGDETN